MTFLFNTRYFIYRNLNLRPFYGNKESHRGMDCVVCLTLVETEPLMFKVRGMREESDTMPAFLTKGMLVELVSGKWPLVDYRDCDCHTFVFQKADGSQFSMLLSGFTYSCTWTLEKQQEAIETGGDHIRITLLELPSDKTTSEETSDPDF